MLIKLLLILFVAALITFGLPRTITAITARNKIDSVATSPGGKIAIVFGAGLLRDGTPSPVLRDRVSTATQLYFAGKVQKILMSGDNRFIDYNEPASMQAYAIDLGVPLEAIVLDYAGRRTYDTCYRARHYFWFARSDIGHSKVSPYTRSLYLQRDRAKIDWRCRRHEDLPPAVSYFLEYPGTACFFGCALAGLG